MTKPRHKQLDLAVFDLIHDFDQIGKRASQQVGQNILRLSLRQVFNRVARPVLEELKR